MRYVLLFSLLLSLSPLLAAPNRAVIFIDSARENQQVLIDEINQMLFFSPTLRSQLKIEVFDINPTGSEFIGEIKYIHDLTGQAVAKYRPGPLPYFICLNGPSVNRRGTLNNKEQLCLCSNRC